MKPDFAIIGERTVEGRPVVQVDTAQAHYQGRRWREMGDFGKRKFDNFLFLTRVQENKSYLKIHYV